MRAEIRIIPMSKKEYEAAMRQYTSSEEERENYWDYLMCEFDEVYRSGMEIASCDDLGTQYYAVIIDKHGESVDSRLYELPESFVNTLDELE